MPISTRLISRLERRTNTKNALKLSIPAMKERLKESYQRYYLLKKDTVSLRKSWLSDLAAIKSKFIGSCQQSTYNNLILRETQRRAGKRLCRVTGKAYSGGLIKVKAKRDRNWEELTNKNNIEDTIHKSNHIKFSQTNSTPTMSSPLV